MSVKLDYESVAVSSRIRLARNFKDYPFPARLLKDPHAEEQASEMIRLLAAELTSMEEVRLYKMKDISDGEAEVLKERHLISRDLIAHRKISAALISEDESISVMINEEDHVREQYFMKGLALGRAYERISGIDDLISDSLPFAYDEELGYLTACPTNLGTGLRASVMLFLPALSRRGRLKRVMPILTRLGLTVRGAFGEGSGAEGDLFQISNEVTLGLSEVEIFSEVERAVTKLVDMELGERARMNVEEGRALEDRIFRSYGILTNCRVLEEKEFVSRISDLKLGIALGLFGERAGGDDRMERLDALLIDMRPGGLKQRSREAADAKRQGELRAEYVAEALLAMKLF